MGDADGMAEDCGLRVPVVIDINTTDKLDQFARLGPKVRPFGIDGFADKMDSIRLSRTSDAR